MLLVCFIACRALVDPDYLILEPLLLKYVFEPSLLKFLLFEALLLSYLSYLDQYVLMGHCGNCVSHALSVFTPCNFHLHY